MNFCCRSKRNSSMTFEKTISTLSFLINSKLYFLSCSKKLHTSMKITTLNFFTPIHTPIFLWSRIARMFNLINFVGCWFFIFSPQEKEGVAGNIRDGGRGGARIRRGGGDNVRPQCQNKLPHGRCRHRNPDAVVDIRSWFLCLKCQAPKMLQIPIAVPHLPPPRPR